MPRDITIDLLTGLPIRYADLLAAYRRADPEGSDDRRDPEAFYGGRALLEWVMRRIPPTLELEDITERSDATDDDADLFDRQRFLLVVHAHRHMPQPLPRSHGTLLGPLTSLNRLWGAGISRLQEARKVLEELGVPGAGEAVLQQCVRVNL